MNTKQLIKTKCKCGPDEFHEFRMGIKSSENGSFKSVYYCIFCCKEFDPLEIKEE